MRGKASQGRDDAAGRRAAGELEAAVLAVLQAAASPLSPGEVRDSLGDHLAYTTVVTILSRLLDAEPDREAVLARFVSGLSPTDEELLRRMLAEPPGATGAG